jgi:Fic family protein
MGLPVDFYEGRHAPDHGQWLAYFLATMAQAADGLRQQAIALYAPHRHPAPPWETLRRVQQQLLTRLLTQGFDSGTSALTFRPGDMVEWFGISANTAREWLEKWREEGFIQPVKADVQRIRTYTLAPAWSELLQSALFSATVSTS